MSDKYLIEKIFSGLDQQSPEKIKEIENQNNPRWNFIIRLWRISRKENKENADNKD